MIHTAYMLILLLIILGLQVKRDNSEVGTGLTAIRWCQEQTWVV